MCIATSGNFFTQFFYYICIHNSYSIVWFTTAAISSVWGFEAILHISVISNKDINSSEKWPQKWGSWLLIIHSRILCWLTAILRNFSAIMCVSDSYNGTNCTILLNLLTLVITIMCLSSSSSLDAKSIWIYYHGWSGMGSGAYSPAAFWVSDLKHWYVSQFVQYSHMLWVFLRQ